ncbi:MAG: hypothetical protein FWE74_05205 [Oscillospiraceae bacterium]|nr:hypothetical protein [Oscillospiraceae bacterium]
MKPVISTRFVIIFSIACYVFTIVLVVTTWVGAELYGNPYILFFASIPYLIITSIVIYIYYQFRILYNIPKIQAPDHKIKVIQNYLRRNTVKVNLPFYGRIRRRFLSMLVVAYADKGDYLAAFETCEEIWKFLPRKFAAATSLTGEEAAIYADEIMVLIHLGRLKPAETLLRELGLKSFSDSAGFFLLKLSHLYLSVYKSAGIAAAREKLGQARSFLSDETIQERFPMKDFKYTLLYLEAKLDMLENKNNEAHYKFMNIMHDSRNYGSRRLAGEELNYWVERNTDNNY